PHHASFPPYNDVYVPPLEVSMYRLSVRGAVFALLVLAAPMSLAADLPRAFVAEFANASKDPHSVIAQSASATVAVDLGRRGVYEVVPDREVNRAAQALGVRTPYREADLERIAKEAGATLLVTGEVHHVDTRNRGGQIEVEVG